MGRLVGNQGAKVFQCPKGVGGNLSSNHLLDFIKLLGNLLAGPAGVHAGTSTKRRVLEPAYGLEGRAHGALHPLGEIGADVF